MKIITLTLNPAFDIHCYTETFQPFHENLVTITGKDPGGKGVNISRALAQNGTKNVSYVMVGEENGDAFLKQLEKESVEYQAIYLPGRIRENITLHSMGQPETRISFPGFSADQSALDTLQAMLLKEDMEDAVVVFAGRIPHGIILDKIKAFLTCLKEKGAKIVLDSRSFAKEDILDIKPWLIKPNEEEIAMYSEEAVVDLDSAKIAAKALKEQGIANVMISLGGQGAVLCCDDGIYAVKPPSVTVQSTIGAGDSTIAGFLVAVEKGLSYGEALKTAVAYGSAACLTEGTKPPKKEAIADILAAIQ